MLPIGEIEIPVVKAAFFFKVKGTLAIVTFLFMIGLSSNL
jgi:hypothetical protein